MASAPEQPISGHVFRVERKRGPQWYAKCRLPDGRQVQKRIGPAWSGNGRPPVGDFTKRMAEDWLREVLDRARRGTLPGLVRTGMTFADAAEEWLRYVEQTASGSHRPSSVTALSSDRNYCRPAQSRDRRCAPPATLYRGVVVAAARSASL